MDIKEAAVVLEGLKVCHQKNKQGLEAIDEVLRSVPSVMSKETTEAFVENMTLRDSIEVMEHLGQTMKHLNRVENHFDKPLRIERNIRAIEDTIAAAKRLEELIVKNILSEDVLKVTHAHLK